MVLKAILYIVHFHIYEVQKQAEQIHGVGNQKQVASGRAGRCGVDWKEVGGNSGGVKMFSVLFWVVVTGWYVYFYFVYIFIYIHTYIHISSAFYYL